MSAFRKSDVPIRVNKDIINLRDKNVVKSLVLEYETVLSQVNCDVTNMGADQSVIKPIPDNLNNGLVKQQIKRFNQLEKEFVKTTRSVSTSADTDKPKKEFQRSKSVDVIKKTNNQNLAISAKDAKKNVNTKRYLKKTSNNTARSSTSKKFPQKNLKAKTEPVVNIKATKEYQILQKNETEENKHSEIDETEKLCKTNGNTDIDEEFDKIEDQLQDVNKTIYELTINQTEPVFTSSIDNFIITNTTCDTNFKDDNQCDDIENIDIYLSQQNVFINDTENEFGEVSKHELQNMDFVEAYNQTGHELLITTIYSVTETVAEDQKSEANKELSLNEVNIDEEKPKVRIFEEKNNFEENDTLEGVNNPLYFSKEELEAIMPDDDYEFYEPPALKTTSSSSDQYLESSLKSNTVESSKISTTNAYLDSIKSETTIYDSFQNPRIAKVRSITNREEYSKNNLLKDDDEAIKNLECKPKIEYIIEELIETEKKYIDHLECVLEDYMPYFKSNNLAPRSIIRTLFGNIKDIYQRTQQLYRTLKRCSNYEAIAKTFLKYKSLFEMYPLYFKNKPLADQHLLGEFKEIISIRERELNDQLGLASHLLTPIQRLGKYILFFQQINKELKKNGITSNAVLMALSMVKKEMTTGNDYIAVDSIKKCPIGLVQQGSFLMREKFKVLKPKKYEAVIFFFEKIIVFTTVHPKNSELFFYKDSIKLDEMGIVTYDDEPLIIHLKRFPSGTIRESEEKNLYVIEAKREKDKKMWTDEIEKRLWDQLIRCRERQLLLHNCAKKTHLFEKAPDTPKKKKSEHRFYPQDDEKLKRRSTFYLTTDT